MTRLAHTRPFIGVCGPNARQVFRASGTPTAERFPEYAAVIGPFRTMRGARWAAAHPGGFSLVSEAERKAARAALARVDSAIVRAESQNQITPGQWCTSPDAVPAGHVQITVYAEDTGKRVSTVFETEANARAIAAVPDMIAALQAVDDYWDHETGRKLERVIGTTTCNLIRAALRKSEGNQ